MHFYINGRESTLSDHVSDDLARAVVNSLFCWRRAEPDDDLPGKSRFGWWADTYADDRFGSRLWLLSRSKMTDDVAGRAESYAREALQWLLDDGVASEVDVTVERDGTDQLNLAVVITKPDQSKLSARFQNVWSDV